MTAEDLVEVVATLCYRQHNFVISIEKSTVPKQTFQEHGLKIPIMNVIALTMLLSASVVDGGGPCFVLFALLGHFVLLVSPGK